MKDIFSHKYGFPVTSDYVFDEAVTVALVRAKNKSVALTLGNALLSSHVQIARVHEGLFVRAWKIFWEKNLSFTDCTILAALEVVGINTLATFDRELANIATVNIVS